MSFLKRIKNYLIENYIVYINKNIKIPIINKLFPKTQPIYKLYYFEKIEDGYLTELVSSIYYKNSWKTTNRSRHTLSDKLLEKYWGNEYTTVIDVGISNGITSLELLRKFTMKIKKIYLVDQLISVKIIKHKINYYFYDNENRCFLVSNKYFSFLLDKKSNIFLFKILKNYLIRKSRKAIKKYKNKIKQVYLLSRELQEMLKKDDRIIVKEWNIFDKWGNEEIDIIKVANVLNLSYFGKDKIEKIIGNFYSMLNEGGLFVIIRNDKTEKCSIFKKKKGSFYFVDRINSGVEIEELVMKFKDYKLQ